MSGRINQPIGQVKLTNVAVVRMAFGKKTKFEIACYRNKVINWRQGLEVDVEQVLQTDKVHIFTNVQKGQFASKDLLQKYFNTTNQLQVAKNILEKGDSLQVSDLERSHQYERLQREIATWIVDNCVNRDNGYPFTLAQIRQAMKEANYIVHPTRPTKRQCMDCYKLIQSKGVLKLERAKMELAIIIVENDDEDNTYDALETVQQKLDELHIVPTKSTSNNQTTELVVLVDPSMYRPLQDLVKKQANGTRLEILQQVVKRQGDSNLGVAEEEEEQAGNGSSVDDTGEQSLSQLQIHDDEDKPAQEAASQPTSKSSNRKKSKKEKRREKEQAAERAERLQAQEQRRKERQQKESLNGSDDDNNVTTRVTEVTIDSSSTSKHQSCNTCGGSFDSTAAYRAHFRSDWHRYNIKLKLKGVAPVSEQEFQLCDADAFFSEDL